ncbi:hypothetical protein BGZ94_009852, partial [Podila epigama]
MSILKAISFKSTKTSSLTSSSSSSKPSTTTTATTNPSKDSIAFRSSAESARPLLKTNQYPPSKTTKMTREEALDMIMKHHGPVNNNHL